jgi:type I restriction enzyme S subunit
MSIKQKDDARGLPITRIETISNSDINLNRVGYADIDKLQAKNFLLEDGEILFSHINSVPHIGKCALYEKDLGELVHGMNLLSFKPNKLLIFPRYALHILRSRQFMDQLTKSIKKAVNQASVSISDIKRISLDIPSLAEQKRIAEILDKAAVIKVKREQAIAKLDEVVQSMYLEMFSNCNEKVSIKDVVLKDKITDHSDGNSVWSLTLEQIESQSGNLIKKIMVDRKELGSSTFYFQSPVVLYSKLRPYLNKVIIPKESGYATTELVPLYASDKVLPIYLATVLRSKRFVEYININSAGAKMPRVIMDKFWDYQIPIPSLAKQKIFSDICNSIENQKINHLNSYSKIQLLIESLQDQAFSAGVND